MSIAVDAPAGHASTQRTLDIVALANFLAIGVMMSAVPRLVKENLGANSTQVGVATTIFFAFAIFSRPLVGRRADRIGRRPFLMYPLLVMAVVALGLGFATEVWHVIALRSVQGAFGAGFYTACAAVATDIAPPDRRGSAVARLSLGIYVGFAIGPFLGEFLFDRSAWAPWILAATLHLIAFGAASKMPETLVAQVASVDRVRDSVVWKAIAWPGAAQLAAGLGYSSLIAFLPSYSRSIGLASSSGMFLTYALAGLATRFGVGRAIDRVGPVPSAVGGLVAMVAGFTMLCTVWTPAVAFVGAALCGVGFGITYPSLTAVAVSRAPELARGTALGAFLSLNDVGNAIAGPLVGRAGDVGGFRWLYGTPAIVATIGLCIAAALLPSHRRSRAELLLV